MAENCKRCALSGMNWRPTRLPPRRQWIKLVWKSVWSTEKIYAILAENPRKISSADLGKIETLHLMYVLLLKLKPIFCQHYTASYKGARIGCTQQKSSPAAFCAYDLLNSTHSAQ